MSGVIYKITHKDSGKAYIGQLLTHTTKEGRIIEYGIKGRWSTHKAKAYKRRSPLSRAINDYGPDAFTIEELKTIPIEELNREEALAMRVHNTLHPNGYNKCRHACSKHREDEGDVIEAYFDDLDHINLNPVCRDGVKAYVCIYLHLKDGNKIVIREGQQRIKEYVQVVIDALKRVIPYGHRGIPLNLHPHLADDELSLGKAYVPENLDISLDKYTDKLAEYDGKVVDRVRIVPFQSTKAKLIAVRILCEKKSKRITFGGVTITPEDALVTAKAFAERLNPKQILISPKL